MAVSRGGEQRSFEAERENFQQIRQKIKSREAAAQQEINRVALGDNVIEKARAEGVLWDSETGQYMLTTDDNGVPTVKKIR